MRVRRITTSWLALAATAGVPAAVRAVDYVVPAGATDPNPKTLGGTDTLTVQQNATLTSTAAQTVNQLDAAANVAILNQGRIDNQAADGRAISTSGGSIDRNITITNAAGAVIVSGEDAIRITTNVGSSTIVIDNSGMIAAAGAGQAIDFDAITVPLANVTITNRAGGIIQASGDDAVRPGAGTVNNAGTIFSDGGAGSASDGVDAQGRPATVNNSGGISGLRHGVASNGTITVNNGASGTIAGRSGAGVGTAGGLTTVSNAGQIAGAVDGVNGQTLSITNLAGGQIIGRTGSGVTGTGTVVVTNDGTVAGATDGVRGGALNLTNNAGASVVGTGGFGAVSTGNAAIVNTGSIVGQAGGVGATFDIQLGNAANATVSGRNGAGVIAASATINNRGVITGGVDGSGTAADGDGINIASTANIANSGLIQGTGAAGRDPSGQANAAAGIAMGGGTINNAAGAAIVGANGGIIVGGGAGGSTGSTSITNLGVIRGAAGPGIQLIGARNDIVASNGTIAGGNGVAIDLGAGDDVLRLFNGTVTNGALDGGEGIDTIFLNGDPGTGGTLAGAVNFEALNVQSGSWITTGVQNFANGTTITNSARVENRGTLGGATSVFAGEIGGSGTFGALTLTGNTSILRPGDAVGGATGAVGTPGTIGTVTVVGDYLQRGGVLALDITPAGLSDRVTVGGTASLQNGVLVVARAPGAYTPGTRYTVLTATGGVTNSFSTLATDPDPLTQLRITYGANAVVLDVLRNGAGLAAAATTPNQRAVAGGIGGLPVNTALFSIVGGVSDNAALGRLFDALSGEIHAAVHLGLLRESERAADVVVSRIETASPRGGLWLQALGGTGSTPGSNGAGKVERDSYGVLGGVDVAAPDGLRGGLALGYTHGKVDVGARASRGDTDAIHAFLYGGGAIGRINLRLEAGLSRVAVDTRRTVALPAASETLRGSYRGGVVAVAGELGYSFGAGAVTLLPFLGAQSFRVDHNGFTETGGISALTVASTNDSFTYGIAGLRAYTAPEATLGVRASLGWRHLFGNRRATLSATFGGIAASRFTAFAAPLAGEAAVAQGDLLWRVAERVRIGVGYSGVIGTRGQDHAVRVTAGVGL